MRTRWPPRHRIHQPSLPLADRNILVFASESHSNPNPDRFRIKTALECGRAPVLAGLSLRAVTCSVDVGRLGYASVMRDNKLVHCAIDQVEWALRGECYNSSDKMMARNMSLDMPYSRLLQVPEDEREFLTLEELKPRQLTELEAVTNNAVAAGGGSLLNRGVETLQAQANGHGGGVGGFGGGVNVVSNSDSHNNSTNGHYHSNTSSSDGHLLQTTTNRNSGNHQQQQIYYDLNTQQTTTKYDLQYTV